MNQILKEMFFKAEGRYFNESEGAQLTSYSEALLSHLETMQTIEQAEPNIIGDAVQNVMQEHPETRTMYGAGGEPRVRRDLSMVLRYATFAMVMQDPDFIHDKLAVWLRVILLSLCKPDTLLTGYRGLIISCRQNLPRVFYFG
jgi:hypothetical protein